MDHTEREMFEHSVAAVVADHDGAALDVALDELGWHDALAGDPRAAISTLFPRLGSTCRTSSSLTSVVNHALGLDTRTPVLWPSFGTWAAPGTSQRDDATVRGLLPGAAVTRGDHAVVVATTATSAVVVETADDSLRPVAGIDPSAELIEVEVRVPADTSRFAADWYAAVRLAQLAVGHELIGVSRTMLDSARIHALERVQFSKPIASFQAIRHRLAEALVAVEGAEALLDAAWDDRSHRTAAMAKATAGRASRSVGRHAQQVLAGIGFTTEHPLHRLVRRSYLLDGLFGSAARLTAEGGRAVLVDGVPPLRPL